MSRHRFVRNMDLDAEMADDDSGEEDGMSPEERAQMASAMMAAKPLLKDLRPPVSDDKLYEALYHYWFDVDKSVAYLKREWEKKGEPVPTHLEPTPEQAPRSRPSKRQRLTQSTSTSASNATSASASAMAGTPDNTLQPPLTALQRLSLSRKQSASASPTSGSPAPSTPARASADATGASEAGSSTPTPPPGGTGPNGGKPMSKLALLAQKRKEAAAAASQGSPAAVSPSSLNTLARASPQPASPAQPASGSPATTGAQGGPTNPAVGKPLSKLAQKMAAAKAAREQAALAAIGIGSVPMTAQSSGSSSGFGSGSVPRAVDEVASNDMDVDSAPPPSIEPEDPLSAFFAPLSLNHAKMPSSTVKPRKSSAFFSIITSTSRVTVETGDVTSTTNIHLPPSRDPSKLENRIKLAFEGAESPDDVVLKARQGRAGTAGMTATATVPGTAGGVAVDKVAKPNHAKKVAPAEDTKPRQKSAQTVVQDAPKAKQVLETGKSKPNASKAKADSTATTTTNSKPKSAPPTKSTDGQGKEPPGKQGGRRPAGKGPKGRGGVSTATGGAGAAAARSVPPTPKSVSQPGKPRIVSAASTPSGIPSVRKQAVSQPGTPRTGGTNSAGTSSRASGAASGRTSVASTPRLAGTPELDGAAGDLAGLHLTAEADEREREKFKERAVNRVKVEELVAKVKKDEEESGKKGISLIVVGHVDAGKSTLMGRLLYEIGNLSEKEKIANERGSRKVGKSSFVFAWGLDALGDERDRGVTIDIATTHFSTPHRNITLLDAPGHRDFIPAMISGAAQADVALLVVDGSPGEFEAGFERGGQTREHACLVRSLGVREVIVGVNKLDVVNWDQDRYDEIVESLKPFLSSAGFNSSKTTFVPLAAMEGVNVLSREGSELEKWYSGPTLIDCLDKVDVPPRPYDSPLRIPLSNVFKGQTAIASGVAVSGRLCSGVVQVGDRLRAVPGDEVAHVRTIEVDEDSAPYAVAGQNVTLYLSGIDPIHLAIGTVLCPTSAPVRLVNQFQAQILTFDLQTPIIAGTAVELFHHSMNVPANITKLVNISEKGQVVKDRPRVLQKGTTALVEITLRSTPGAQKAATIPLEIASVNKEMGRVLIRRTGETIAAGVVMGIVA